MSYASLICFSCCCACNTSPCLCATNGAAACTCLAGLGFEQYIKILIAEKNSLQSQNTTLDIQGNDVNNNPDNLGNLLRVLRGMPQGGFNESTRREFQSKMNCVFELVKQIKPNINLEPTQKKQLEDTIYQEINSIVTNQSYNRLILSFIIQKPISDQDSDQDICIIKQYIINKICEIWMIEPPTPQQHSMSRSSPSAILAIVVRRSRPMQPQNSL